MKRKLSNNAMKSVALLLLSLLVVSCGMLHNNADSLVNHMRDARHAQYVNVGSGLLGLGRILSPSLSEAGLGISSVQYLDLTKCSFSDREKYRKSVLNLSKNRSYDVVMTQQDGYDTRTALVRRDGQHVNEIVIAKASELSDVIVVIHGHINVENLERIVNDQNRYFNNK